MGELLLRFTADRVKVEEVLQLFQGAVLAFSPEMPSVEGLHYSA